MRDELMLFSDPAVFAEPDLEELERRLGVAFGDPTLLRKALIHKSLTNEVGESGLASNERLEFLGDALIGAYVAELLYARFPDRDEGGLTQLRAALVRGSNLASWGRRLGLGAFVRIGRSEAPGLLDRDSLLSSAFEAVVGAVYLDRGFRAARKLVHGFARREIARVDELRVVDAKSRLQQVSQALYSVTPTYEVLEVSGLGHSPTFTVRVTAGGGVQATAEGRSKQGAQQTAAAEALAVMEGAIDDQQVAADEAAQEPG
jgi:ribonuclease-3